MLRPSATGVGEHARRGAVSFSLTHVCPPAHVHPRHVVRCTAQVGTAICRQLLAAGTKSLHFYTMNLSMSVRKILQGLNLVPARHERTVPWKVQDATRGIDEVRPIFWQNRAASYLSRTSAWDEFPNGRWGDNRSAAYGNLTDYYLSFKRPKVGLWHGG